MTAAEARAPERSVPERTPFKSLASRPGAIVYTADFAFHWESLSIPPRIRWTVQLTLRPVAMRRQTKEETKRT